MRILLTSHYALPHLGGIEVAIDGLARALARRGHEVVQVASSALRSGEAAPREPAGERPYQLHRVPAFNGFEERLGVPWPLFAPRLAGVLRREVPRADVVHAHGFLYLPTPLALGLARRNRPGAARVLTEHVGLVGYEQPVIAATERAAVGTVGRASLALAQGVVVLNPTVRELVARSAGSRPVELIPNGVDTDRYRPPAPEERARLRERLGWDARPRALFVGRLVAKKGLELALGAAAASGAELIVAGPGRPPPSAPAGVRFLGSRPREAVAELYRAADVFVLPSRGEGFPVTVQEALASGLPVVLLDDPAYAPYVDGAREAIRLVDATPAAVAAGIRSLAEDPDARERASAQAAEHARARFSWEHAAAEHERLYERVRA